MSERKTHRGVDGLLYDEDGYLVYEGTAGEDAEGTTEDE
jgi:hypothetical protein